MKQEEKNTKYLEFVYGSENNNRFLRHSLKTFHANYFEIAKLELKKRIKKDVNLNYNHLKLTLDRIRNREDMAEFGIPSLIRMLKAYKEYLSINIIKEIEETLIGFRYWLDEPGEIKACYFSENHQPLYHSAEYLVGSMFENTIFPSNNLSGKWHKEHGKTFLSRWIKWRKQFGFSEWCTNYYSEDILALLGVYYYADDVKLRNDAKELIDTLLIEIALNTFEGHWIGSHGRTYTEYQIESSFDSIGPICNLFFDEGPINGHLADCAICLAAYNYNCPPIAIKIAKTKNETIINKERIGLDTEMAELYKVDPKNFDNIMFFWGNQTFDNKLVINNSKKVLHKSNWMNERINAHLDKYKICEKYGIPYDSDPDFTALTQANIYTYKTKDYAISCAQDFRKGKLGYQQQPWGASLGNNTYVFTTHPGSNDYSDRPNQIAGNGILPRCVQQKNVVICIYRIPADYIRFLETHAYFPQKEFDEIKSNSQWLFGKHNNAYIALFSLQPTHWVEPDSLLYKTVYEDEWTKYYDKNSPYFYQANGHTNVWIAEFGSYNQDGDFNRFCAKYNNVAFEGDTLSFNYNSPALGKVSFGWNEPFKIEEKEITINNYMRFDNSFFKKEFIKPEECM